MSTTKVARKLWSDDADEPTYSPGRAADMIAVAFLYYKTRKACGLWQIAGKRSNCSVSKHKQAALKATIDQRDRQSRVKFSNKFAVLA